MKWLVQKTEYGGQDSMYIEQKREEEKREGKFKEEENSQGWYRRGHICDHAERVSAALQWQPERTTAPQHGNGEN